MWRKVIGITLIAVLLGLGFAGVAHASNLRTGVSPSVGANQVVDNTLWIAGQTVDVAGSVNGDVFCAGQDVIISGHVSGDVICAAQTIIISGRVDGNIRAAASTVTLTGSATGNATIAAQSFTQTAGSSIGADASIAGANLNLNGTIGRDALLAGSTVQIDGGIGRNVKAETPNLSLGSGSNITGNLQYTSQNDVSVADGAKVGGSTTKTIPTTSQRNTAAERFWGQIAFDFFALVALLFMGLVLVLIAPRAFNSVTSIKNNEIWKPLLVGLVAMVVVPFLIIVAMSTVIGLPLGFLILLAWIVVGLLSLVVASYWFGRVIWAKQRNVVPVLIVGIVALAILMAIPILGGIVWFLATLLGSGLILMNAQKRLPKANYTIK